MQKFKATVTLFNPALSKEVSGPLQNPGNSPEVFECESLQAFMHLVADHLPRLANFGVEVVKVNTERVA